VRQSWRLLTPRGARLHRVIPAPVAILLTFLCVVLSLVFFRAANVHDALHVVATMAGFHGAGTGFAAFPYLNDIPTVSRFMASLKPALLALAICFSIVWGMPNTQEILGQLPHDQVRTPSLLPRLMWSASATWSLGIAMLFCISLLLLDASTRFLYFQF
jgi:alginate O-acetyltransferase complex protein AlgI